MASFYDEGTRHAVVTANNCGAVLEIVAWFLMVVMILATALKLVIRLIARQPGVDDVLVTIAMLFGVGEVVAISLAANDGLGRRAELLDSAQIKNVQKRLYASSILYVVTLAFAKASIVILMSRLFVEKRHVTVNRILSAALLVWSLAAIFGAAFQCGLPHPWRYFAQTCSNTNTFWYVIGAFDILLDLALVASPAYVIQGLKMEIPKKVVIISAFALRIIVVAAQIVRLTLLPKYDELADPTYPIAFPIATQIQTTLAVMASCAPALRPFIDRVSTGGLGGLLGVSLANRDGTYDVSGSYRMRDLSVGVRNSRNSKTGSQEDFSPYRSNYRAIIFRRDDGKKEDEEQIIRKTTGFEIEYSTHPMQSDNSTDREQEDGVQGHTTI
ncbi:hypothetical protein M433DRAFT_26790 [Acidomyces richmondensis BFW]|nr:hypothetical protein M433DRAFT_26790 [Acidomyces richmondensis BFW]